MRRIRLVMSIEVDPDVWADTFDPTVGQSVNELRDDVRRYAVEQVSLSPAADEGAITDVRWDR